MTRHAVPPTLAMLAVLAMLRPAPARADVVRIEILSRAPAVGSQNLWAVGPFEIVRGRVYGELDPADPHNRLIQDLTLAPKNARGRVEYVATFALAKPVDMTRASRVLLYQVVNRGNGQVTIGSEGYISLISGWQGDVAPTPNNQTIVVPIARNPDGTAITGPMVARFLDVPTGTTTVPIRLSSMGTSPEPYPPADLNEAGATLTMHAEETPRGVSGDVVTVPRGAWAFADCREKAFPGTPDPTRVCVRDGFRADRVYELNYTARDPLVLGVGLAATRDLVSFFRYASHDRSGTPNPVAGAIDKAVSIGDSQSGNFIRSFVHLGFNQDESNRIVWDGVFPRIAARQTPLNHRFALPGGAASMYEVGSDGVVWWSAYEDRARGVPRAGLLDRCTATKTCPKVIEAFGSSEFWGLRMSPDLIGTDAKADIPLPDNVRRYYYPGTTHGGGRGGFRIEAGVNPSARCVLADNPNPEADTTRALTRALVEWVTNGTPPPQSRYPMLAHGDLVPATAADMGLPKIPGLPFNENILNPVLQYDFGGSFIKADLTGVVTQMPPRVIGVIPTYVPRVNADGNETVGVASVLYHAALGTYLGWNAIRSGVLAGQGCGYTGGYLPFAKTKAQRLATGDPRLSVEERYGTQEGYVCTVQKAVDRAVHERFLLPEDGRRLMGEVLTSTVLPPNAASSHENVALARARCGP